MSFLETSFTSVEMRDASEDSKKITLQTQVESNSNVKVHLFALDDDNYLIVAREGWIDIYLLYEEDNHLTKACSIKSDLQIIDFIFDHFNIYVLCSDGSLLLTTLSYHQDANIFTFSSWNQLNSTSNNFPVKLLRYNDTIVICHIENEIQFINLSNGKIFTYQYNGVHFDSCALGDYLFLCINSTNVYKMKFNEEYNLIESEMIKSPFDIISLHVSQSKIIGITADSRIIDIETLDQLLKVETDQLISDYHLLQKGYLCTEHGDIYAIDGNQSNMIYSKLGVDKICKSTQETNFLIGYSSVSDLIYIPLEESMTDLQPRSLLPNISYVTDFDKKGDEFIIATPKRLCSVKKGMSCRVTSLTDESYDGIDNVFTPTTDFIILSFVNQSKVLRISEESIDECNNNVFESSQATFYCSQILDSFILQVTATEMRLMDLQFSTLLSSIKINNTVVTSKANNIYVSYENKITKFEVNQEGQLIESFSINLDRDVSSMRATESNHLIASTYSGIIYFISGSTISKTIDINSHQIETNIVESIFYTGSLLLLGLRDGHLLVYDIDQLIKKFKLGDVPVQLRESFDDIIIAVSNNCYYISVDSMNLNISNLLVNDHILSVQNFNVTGYENSLLCLSSDSKIKVISIETTNFQPMIKEVYSNEDCQRVHINEEDNSILYVCNNYSSLKFINDNKETLTLYSFPPSEKIYSITSFKVKNDDSHDSNFVIVGTKYTRHHNNIIMNKDPTSLSHGFLHVLKLGKVSDAYKCEHVGSCELPYMVYSMKQYNNQYLIVAYGERLGLFHFDQKEMKLVDQANVRHFVNSVDICDNLICITDRFDGLLFYIIQEGKFYYLNNVSLRLDALNSATCRFISSKRVATIDRSHQLIIWRINNVNASTHTISLSKEKSFDTKELALKVLPISNHQLFYITLNGSVNYLNIEE